LNYENLKLKIQNKTLGNSLILALFKKAWSLSMLNVTRQPIPAAAFHLFKEHYIINRAECKKFVFHSWEKLKNQAPNKSFLHKNRKPFI